MTAYVCLLFAVNLGGRSVPSTQLRQAAEAAGLGAPRTVGNSGNLVVAAGTVGAEEATAVARSVESLIAKDFSVETTVVALPTSRLAAIVAANPFPAEAADDPSHLVAMIGTQPVDAAGVNALRETHSGTERLAVVDGVLYTTFPDGIGRSKLTTKVLGRAAGTSVTGRNWNTVCKLLDVARSLEA